MILVVGSLASGKRSFVRTLGYADADTSTAVDDGALVLVDAQELVRDAVADVDEIAMRLARDKQVVCCVEVGSGIVPLDRSERAWRERAGELSRKLAERASAVVRLTCGIPQILKGAIDLGGGKDRCKCASTPAPGLGRSFSATFFTNRACAYFPCHEGVDEHEFNCLFCYCPLYALGPDCGGNFTYTERGRKNCAGCSLPHEGENGAKLVAARYEQLAKLAANR